MTVPTNGHGHGHGSGHGHEPPPPFMPDAHFAVQAQQEEINELREEVFQVKKKASDRIIYMRSVMLQIQAEAQHQASMHLGTIENQKIEIEKLRRQLFAATGEGSESPTDASEGAGAPGAPPEAPQPLSDELRAEKEDAA